MLNDTLAKSNLETACRNINTRYFRGSPTFYVDSGMNIYLGVNTLNQFHSYSTPYPVEAPISRNYGDDKYEVSNPVYVQPQNVSPQVPVMVTAQVVQPQAQPQPQVQPQAQPQTQPPSQQQIPPPAQTVRHAQFVVPAGVSPGSSVTTVSPAGGEVSIVIPADATPGSVVTYSY